MILMILYYLLRAWQLSLKHEGWGLKKLKPKQKRFRTPHLADFQVFRAIVAVCGILSGMFFISGCDDEPLPATVQAPKPVHSPPVAKPASPSAAAAAQPATSAEAKGPVELKDKDFSEGPNNRDPFRSFLAEFTRPVHRVVVQQRKVLLQRYALDELKLIAVVAGGSRPVAMFRDPTGLGVTVKRGDYVSKNAARIKQILTDKVVVEIEEQAEDKNSLIDRVIDLHPKEDQETEESQ